MLELGSQKSSNHYLQHLAKVSLTDSVDAATFEMTLLLNHGELGLDHLRRIVGGM